MLEFWMPQNHEEIYKVTVVFYHFEWNILHVSKILLLEKYLNFPHVYSQVQNESQVLEMNNIYKMNEMASAFKNISITSFDYSQLGMLDTTFVTCLLWIE